MGLLDNFVTSASACSTAPVVRQDESSDICGDAVPVFFQPDTELPLGRSSLFSRVALATIESSDAG